MLCKLAWGNVRRARRDYLVYLVTLGIGVMVFYAFNTISVQVDIAGIKELGMRELMGRLMAGMTIFLAFVMGFLLVYANNFIMKRRKKEFGLYQVLGMSRWQVARVMALETVIVSVAALAAGLVAGIAVRPCACGIPGSPLRCSWWVRCSRAWPMHACCMMACRS